LAGGRAKFFWEFLKHPSRVGAVAPSSTSLAREMVAWLELREARAVVEFGPGTGIFTAEILPRLAEGSAFFAIEQNPAMVEILRRRFPEVRIFADTVANVRRLCDGMGIDEIDCLLCGLPWASFSEAQQNAILTSMMSALKPGGQFVTFAYLQGLLLPAGRRFKRKLGKYFSEISKSRTVWWNLPPAFVYRCRR
jgi:phospholipid N-methyltransferase